VAGAVTLVPVTATNWRAALSLRVTPEQLPYVADHQPVAAIALSKAHVGAMNHTWYPLLVQHGPTPVGFLALTHPTADPTEAWLFHFFIDHHHQRQGHARAAMHALIAHLRTRTPRPNRLNLLVNPANTPAQSLYLACGLAFTGATIEGDLVMTVPILTLPT
jgi:diamine N-acetyltransferase